MTAPAYPTSRFSCPFGYRLEVVPLMLGRGRIISTDGVSVDTFW